MNESLSTLKTTMDMYQAQYASTDKLWAYFSTVSLALVAFTISSDKVTRVVPEAVVAVAAYVVFCSGNFSALCGSQRQLIALAKLVRKQGAAHELDDATFPVFSIIQIGVFYWFVVAVIVSASVGLVWFRSGHMTGAL